MSLWALSNQMFTLEDFENFSAVMQTIRHHPKISILEKTADHGRLVEKIVKRGDHLSVGVMASYDLLEVSYRSQKHVNGYVVDTARKEISALIFKEVEKKARKSVSARSSKISIRGKIVKNLEVDFADPDLIPQFHARDLKIPAGFAKRKTYPFVKVLKSGASAAEPINALELALIFASETKKYPGTEKCFKQYYTEKLLSLGVSKVMKDNVTPIHIACLAVEDSDLLFNIVKKIHELCPEQLKQKTTWTETVLHYLLGSASLCQTPLELIKFFRNQGVNLDVKSQSMDNFTTADHSSFYAKSKWYNGPQRDEIISYLHRWRQSKHRKSF